ncbi:MAG: type II toxin-antitoxin system VapC family toxin [Gammaproteobacteria bacterium]|nr:type II toxin-antitoxin system VapC family toxin [Gammaproteobacteria bacterium]
MLKYLLDTNIIIYVIKYRPPHVREIFNSHIGQLGMSTISLAELYHGAEKSQAIQKNLLAIEDFISRLDVLSYDHMAAAHYGDIRAVLEKTGTPIGVNDLHIAGHARSSGLILVSNNLSEFARVPGLRVENWIEQ